MGMKPLRVGLIGAGAIARQRHLPYWQELAAEGRIALHGVCDIIPERAEAAAADFGAAASYLDYKKMLKAGDYDIIDVCTQNRLHAPITIAALDAGAHVLVEKPMAMNTRECERMIAAAKKGKRTLMVAQHMRFEAPHEKLKAAIEAGELGEIYAANAHWLRRRGIPGWGVFHMKKESLGGPLIDIGVHMMDLCVWLMGSPKAVAASGKVYRKFGDRPDLVNGEWGIAHRFEDFDVEDYCSGYVRFEKDITMSVEFSWAANIAEERYGVTILGDKAGAGTHPLGIFGAEYGALTHKGFDWLPDQEGHRGEIRHFTECIEHSLPVRVQPSESLQIQKIIDALYESSRRNAEVRIR